MSLNRTLAPAQHEIGHVQLIEPERMILDNGIHVYLINAGEQELVRIEFIFPHVNWDASQPLRSTATLSLFNEGTSRFTSAELAENLDYYGAFLQTDFTFDHATVALYSLNKHIPAVLPYLKAMLTDAVFPDKEVAIYSKNQQEKYKINFQKNEFLARRGFNHALFGETLYGHEVELNDFTALNADGLRAYFAAGFHPKLATVIISGKISTQLITLLKEHFSDWESSAEPGHRNHFAFENAHQAFQLIEKPDALQSALRMGKKTINRLHADYPALQVLNTVLGGYFGSRLMNNIREDKGYTYGIGSAVVSLQQSGYFFIASEVGAEVCADALKEIGHEMLRLKEHQIPADELERVKNYMLGTFVGSFENAFSHADKFKNIFFAGLSHSYYSRYVETIRHITSVELLHLAQRYLHENEMTTIVAGKCRT